MAQLKPAASDPKCSHVPRNDVALSYRMKETALKNLSLFLKKYLFYKKSQRKVKSKK